MQGVAEQTGLIAQAHGADGFNFDVADMIPG